MTSGPDSVFKRRKFTIMQSLDDILQNMAEGHYQGNVSLCLRSAIEDHRATLDGEGRIAMKRIGLELHELQNTNEELTTALEEIEARIEEVSDHQRRSQNGDYELLTDDMRSVRHTILDADDSLRIDDILERLDLPASRILPALGDLIDCGYLCEVDENNSRYELAGYQYDQTGEQI